MENENLENKPNVKKSNLRNYDENPIVIRDFIKEISFYMFFPAIFDLILTKILFDKGIITFMTTRTIYSEFNNNKIFISSIIATIILAIWFKKRIGTNDTKFKFFNSKISLSAIISIETNSLKETNFIIDKRTMLLPIFLVVVIFSLFVGAINMAYAFSSLIIVIYCPFMILSIIRNGSLGSLFSFSFLAIKTKHGEKIIPIITKQDKDDLRKYFLEVAGIDIEKKINYLMIKTF
ncbi:MULTISPECIES: hypothetical protein [unclassified Campylobacter]|uniref:hypothetical protein n=1 Tax=unclassified Campylobacter TaxID=2593542 RepID=UPI0022E9B9CC|nr:MULTISPECIES: hypothetical protein [unclassified Campylobacter]MDA3062474.1 hypothetical protein [Campylobacter sp. JMF_14 EL1]MDA3073407.1 hypothetical protein [Campylobacter sp. JMF_10 EL2]